MDETKTNISYDIPHDVVEIILSRLPVKSLLRFRGVCKQWSATISDPKFAETHLERSRDTSNCSYLRRERKTTVFERVHIENNEFQKLSTSTPEDYCEIRVLCHCDGLFLFSRKGSANDYVVWNPSIRTYKEVRCPYQMDADCCWLNYGICYDPLLKDYKLVIGNNNQYAVYYFRKNSWSELKEMNNVKIMACYNSREGVHLNGSIYWISRPSLDQYDQQYMFEIVVCFDGRDEEMKNVCIPHNRGYEAKLISSRDCLYFMPMNEPSFCNIDEMVIMKKVGESPWKKLKVKADLNPQFPCQENVHPLSSIQENYNFIVCDIDVLGKNRYLLYDETKGCLTNMQNASGNLFLPRLFPYLENLFLL